MAYTTTCEAWNKTNRCFRYPELTIPRFSDKLDLGIALPGGGIRACVYSLGVMRGLHHLGVLQNAKYITAVSGSSWLTTTYCYQNVCSSSDFLGEYIAPRNLTLEKLSNSISDIEFASVIPNFNIALNLVGNLIEESVVDSFEYLLGIKNTPEDCWSETIGEQMFVKYKLNDFCTVPYIDTVYLGRGGSGEGEYTHIQSLRNDAPFPIVLGGVICDTCKTHIEFTSLYYGLPVSDCGIVGTGMYVEPIGFLAFSQQKEIDREVSDNHHFTFDVSSNNIEKNVISILKTSGISSNYIPMDMNASDKTTRMMQLPYIDYFGQTLKLVDGGVIGESNGVSSLLQRRVGNIIFVSTIQSSDDESQDNKYMVNNNTTLASFFTAGADTQLFKSECLDKLLKSFNRLIDQKLPLVVKMNVEIVSNKKYGLILADDETYTPTITFIHPSRNEWFDIIPTETCDYINNSATNDMRNTISYSQTVNATFKHYPFTSFKHLNVSAEYVVAMSQNACFDVIRHAELFM